MNNIKKYLMVNWKMNKDSSGILDYFSILNQSSKSCKWHYNFMLAVSATYIKMAQEQVKLFDLPINIFAQDFYHENNGAFTGNTSADQLSDLQVAGSLVGHSECRQHLNQTNKIINKKTLVGLNKQLKIVLCVGEDKTSYENYDSWKIVSTQIKSALTNVTAQNSKNIFIAYEPIWAIGTGLVPTSDIVSKITKQIKELITELYGTTVTFPVLYGGSVQPNNFLEFLNLKSVDGILVGGAGLDPIKTTQMLSTNYEE